RAGNARPGGRVSDLVRSLGIAARSAVGIGEVPIVRHAEPITGGNGSHARHLPAAHHGIKRAAGLSGEALSVPDRQFIDIAAVGAVGSGVGSAWLPFKKV